MGQEVDIMGCYFATGAGGGEAGRLGKPLTSMVDLW